MPVCLHDSTQPDHSLLRLALRSLSFGSQTCYNAHFPCGKDCLTHPPIMDSQEQGMMLAVRKWWKSWGSKHCTNEPTSKSCTLQFSTLSVKADQLMSMSS